MVKALAITTIHRLVDGKHQVVPASTAQKVSVFNATDDELAELVKLNGARKATKEEIALSKAQAQAEGNAVDDDDVAATTANAPKSEPAPRSGAAGDPQSSPKGSTGKKAGQDDDLGV